MGGTKKQKHCGYVRPHAGHVWRDPKSKLDRKHWCSGTASDAHVHIWDAGVVRRDGFPVNGPAECPCGASAWLHNGTKKRDLKTEARFPHADTLERIMALKAKLDRGEELSEEDKAELQAIGQALMEAIKPLVDAIQKMFEQIGEYITAFLDQVDPVLIAELVEMSKANGEKPDAVETVEVMTADGKLLEHVVLSHEPLAATQHAATEIVEDSVQTFVAPDPSDPVEIAKQAIKDQFNEPFHLSLVDGEMVQGGSLLSEPVIPGVSTSPIEIPKNLFPEPGSPLERAARRAAQDGLLNDTLRRYHN